MNLYVSGTLLRSKEKMTRQTEPLSVAGFLVERELFCLQERFIPHSAQGNSVEFMSGEPKF